MPGSGHAYPTFLRQPVTGMLKQARVDYILQKLQELYPQPPIPLDHKDPFTLLVAVLLSAQCTDERVNKVTPALFQLANNSRDMARQTPEAIREIIRPCGLSPQKSKAIAGLSKILVDDHNGEVPADIDILETLPGVGHKTASVVMSQAFGVAAFPVDTHIHRLAQRWGLSSGKNVTQTEKDLKRLFPEDSWNALHLQIIYYGREYCSARGCDGTVCEICRTCYPNRKHPKKTRKA
jgi:endonuclease-3